VREWQANEMSSFHMGPRMARRPWSHEALVTGQGAIGYTIGSS